MGLRGLSAGLSPMRGVNEGEENIVVGDEGDQLGPERSKEKNEEIPKERGREEIWEIRENKSWRERGG